MMFKNLEHTCIIINKETLHDTCVALIRDLKVSGNKTSVAINCSLCFDIN